MDSECSLVSDSTWICSRLFAYMIGKPDLSQNGWFVGLFSIAMYWLATWLTFKGTSIISRITSQGFLLGTVLPEWSLSYGDYLDCRRNPIAFEHVPDTVTQVVNVNAGHVHPRFFPSYDGISDIAFWRVFYCCLPESRYMPYMSGK